jgi:hypothetical protein
LVYDDGEIREEERIRRIIFSFPPFLISFFSFVFLLLLCEKRIEMNIKKTQKTKLKNKQKAREKKNNY